MHLNIICTFQSSDGSHTPNNSLPIPQNEQILLIRLQNLIHFIDIVYSNGNIIVPCVGSLQCVHSTFAISKAFSLSLCVCVAMHFIFYALSLFFFSSPLALSLSLSLAAVICSSICACFCFRLIVLRCVVLVVSSNSFIIIIVSLYALCFRGENSAHTARTIHPNYSSA